MIKSIILGISVLTILFFLCLSLVLGIKTLKEIIKARYFKPAPPPVKISKPPSIKPKKPKIVKSIEINPDEVERIYVKKSS